MQNALSNVGDLVSRFNVEPEEAHGSDPMDAHDAHGTDARPAPVSFLSEPEKYVRIANTHALGNLVCRCCSIFTLCLLQWPVYAHQKRLILAAGAFITTHIASAAH